MSASGRPWNVTAAVALSVIVWSYWSTILDAAERWQSDPQYSHGWLVPLFSAYLLYSRRQSLFAVGPISRWWGLVIVIVAITLRGLAYYFYLPWLDGASLLVCLAGLAAVLGGWHTLRGALPAILFLVFMIPLPYRIQQALGTSLQSIATKASTYLLQTAGVPAISEGNIILLSEQRIGVFQACNGLSMLMTFLALSVGFALVIQRHWLYTVILVLAAFPIAVGANVIRITVTGLLFESSRSEDAQTFFHDMSGWVMMPIGALMLMALLAAMDRAVRLSPSPN